MDVTKVPPTDYLFINQLREIVDNFNDCKVRKKNYIFHITLKQLTIA